MDTKKQYKSQDLSQLLPWSNNELVVDARLRFNANTCDFTKYDDEQIQKFNQDFFASEGEQLFSNIQVNAALLTEQLYKDTCLRDMQNQEVYSFDVEDDELSIYQHFPDSVELNIQTGKYEQAVKSVTFNIEPAPDNAWLSLSPAQLKELTLEYGLPVQEGCKLSLSVYNDQSPQWIYHLGFGVYH